MKNKNSLVLLAVVALGACAAKPPAKKPIIYPSNSPEVTTTKPKETSIIAKQLAAEQGSNFVTELTFKKGGAILALADQKKIREQYQKAKAEGRLEEAQLITWADQEFPTDSKKELPPSQKSLVDKRNESLASFIATLDDGLTVKKISMAERAGAVAKFTASDEAKVKEALDAKDAPGKASESMVIFILKK